MKYDCLGVSMAIRRQFVVRPRRSSDNQASRYNYCSRGQNHNRGSAQPATQTGPPMQPPPNTTQQGASVCVPYSYTLRFRGTKMSQWSLLVSLDSTKTACSGILAFESTHEHSACLTTRDYLLPAECIYHRNLYRQIQGHPLQFPWIWGN